MANGNQSSHLTSLIMRHIGINDLEHYNFKFAVASEWFNVIRNFMTIRPAGPEFYAYRKASGQ
jgi:hypothetical protein